MKTTDIMKLIAEKKLNKSFSGLSLLSPCGTHEIPFISYHYSSVIFRDDVTSNERYVVLMKIKL